MVGRISGVGYACYQAQGCTTAKHVIIHLIKIMIRLRYSNLRNSSIYDNNKIPILSLESERLLGE